MSTTIKGWADPKMWDEGPVGFRLSRIYEAKSERDLPATLIIGDEPVFTEAQVKAMVDDIKVIAAENAHKCYTNRIEQMTPPAPVAFHIDNYMWKKHGIKL